MFTPSKPKVVIALLFRKWRESRAELKRRRFLFDILMRRFKHELLPLMRSLDSYTLHNEFPTVTFGNGRKEQFFKPTVLQGLKMKDGVVHDGIYIYLNGSWEMIYAQPTKDGGYGFRHLTARKLNIASLEWVLEDMNTKIKDLESFRSQLIRALSAPPKRQASWQRQHRHNNSYVGLVSYNRN